MAKDKDISMELTTTFESRNGSKMKMEIDQSDPKDVAAAKELAKTFIQEDAKTPENWDWFDKAYPQRGVIVQGVIAANTDSSGASIEDLIDRYQVRHADRLSKKTMYEYGQMQRKFAAWLKAGKGTGKVPLNRVGRPEIPAGSRIGMESTGIYNELFANLAHKLGFIVFVLNPKDARHYAKGVGLRGKTDRVDAELIARMIAHEHTKLHAWMPPSPEQHEIAQLIKRRAKLSSLRQALAMSLKGLNGFTTDLKTLRQRFDQVIVRIDQRVKELVEANPDRKEHVTHLRTIYGVGPVVSAALVNTLERMPLKSADAFVAFTGLDPRPDDSGQHQGKRRLSKRGPSELRWLLYLAAMSAKKTKAWKPLFEHYRAKGLSTTACFVILARRIARTAWSMYTYKTEFDPGRLTKGLT